MTHTLLFLGKIVKGEVTVVPANHTR